MDILIWSQSVLSPNSPMGVLPSSWLRWPARGGPTDCELAGLSTDKVARPMTGRKRLPAPSASLDATVAAAFPVSCRTDCLSAKRQPVDRCADFPLADFAQLPTAGVPELRRLLDCQGDTPSDNAQPTVPTTAFVSADANPFLTAMWRGAWCLARARQNPTLIDIAARNRGSGCPGSSRPSRCFAERHFGGFHAADDIASMTADPRPSLARLVGDAALGMPQAGGCCGCARWPSAVGSAGGSRGYTRNSSLTCGLLGPVMPSRCLPGRSDSSNVTAGPAGGLPRKLEEKGKQDGSRIRDRVAARRRAFSQLELAQ
ncbi:hypothetical protein J2Y54_002200 [Sphingomonas sp. BE123]|jgi:hypothetical protein|nr:hypothetical protein [Sphingomonas sp. BE123]